MSAEASATLRLDAIKTALTVSAGLGAGITLIVALRRQSISERSQRHIEEDSREQRITTLYVAAAGQLGNDKAAVRLAGLYALERLGQDNPKLRQTVVDVWCAYLRMPYTPPAIAMLINAEHSPYALAEGDPHPEPEQQPERLQEQQVRLTAQRLLRDHTKVPESGPEPTAYWRGQDGELLNLDLTGAVLIDFDLAACRSGTAVFDWAQFHGEAHLGRAQFHGDTRLGGAKFHGFVDLTGAQFHGVADLTGAQFYGDTRLGGAQFHGFADMTGAQFHTLASLNGAHFREGVDLTKAQATEEATLPPEWALAAATREPLRPVVHVRGASEAAPPSPPTLT